METHCWSPPGHQFKPKDMYILITWALALVRGRETRNGNPRSITTVLEPVIGGSHPGHRPTGLA